MYLVSAMKCIAQFVSMCMRENPAGEDEFVSVGETERSGLW